MKKLRVNVSKTRGKSKKCGHGQKIDFAHTLSVSRPRYVSEGYEISFLKYSIQRQKTTKNGHPTGSSDFTTRELEISHFSASRCTDIYIAVNRSLV